METLQADAIKRRADEVAGWLHSVIDIPDSPFGTPPPHGESQHKIHFGMPDAFPRSIREEHHKYYEPRVVSIGPFHHGKDHLAPMETFKRQAVRILAESGNVSIELAYATVEQDLLRIAKECYDVSRWGRISDPELCLMMFLDGCFIIVFLCDNFKSLASSYGGVLSLAFSYGGVFSIVKKFYKEKFRRQLQWLAYSFGGVFSIMKKHDRELVYRDLLLLENQLPLEVLRVLQLAFRSEITSGFEYLPSLILRMQLMTFSALLSSKLVDIFAANSDSPTPVHLLQRYRHILVGVLSKEGKEEENLAFCPSYSVTELKKVGIRCSYVMDRLHFSLRDIHFESSILSGHLFLPPLTISEWTLTLFSNLLAYEYSHNLQNRSDGITSYLRFMSMLINGVEDVKELRARGVLQLDLKDGDDQVVSFFRDLTAHLEPNHQEFIHVKQQIFIYLQSKRLPLRIAYAELKQRYFSGPWSFLVFLAVIFTVSMTVIQTVLTGIQTYK